MNKLQYLVEEFDALATDLKVVMDRMRTATRISGLEEMGLLKDREWVKLTTSDIEWAIKTSEVDDDQWVWHFAELLENRLKDKNS